MVKRLDPSEYFNPRSREGSDKTSHIRGNTNCHFNPRSREGSDPVSFSVLVKSIISIHAPAKGATYRYFHALHLQKDFNPRSREGSDVVALNVLRMAGIISIHAPAKGATKPCKHCVVCSIISIHAPAKGATSQQSMQRSVTVFQSTLPRRERRVLRKRHSGRPRDFNPRSREGSDRFSLLCCRNTPISIHAPAKGATHIVLDAFLSYVISIHAPAKGATASANSKS